jgi:hypothetical protein
MYDLIDERCRRIYEQHCREHGLEYRQPSGGAWEDEEKGLFILENVNGKV